MNQPGHKEHKGTVRTDLLFKIIYLYNYNYNYNDIYIYNYII